MMKVSRRRPLLTACLMVSACVLTGDRALATRGASDRPDLVGVWVLNHDRSDAPGDEDRGDPRPGGLGTSPGIGSSGPMSGAGVRGPLMGGRRVDPGLRDRMRALARIAFEAPERLTVTADGETLRMVGSDGHLTRLMADGSKVEELAGTVTVERRTRWDRGRLVTELKAKDGGGEVKQVYSRDGDRMVVESTFDAEVAARTEKMKFVYDRQDR